MNPASPYLGNLLRKARRLRRHIIRKREYGEMPPPHASGQGASDLILEKLQSPKPFMLGRLGRCEIRGTLQVVDIRSNAGQLNKSWDYIKGRIGPFWWDKHTRKKLHINAGFFPPTNDMICRYADRMLQDIQEIDILGSMHPEENRMLQYFPEAARIPITDIEPYHHNDPWSKALEGKKVLVIYPFIDSIHQQYKKRKHLFEDSRVLPDFELKTIQAVQSVGGTKVDYPDWFAALDSMCQQMDQTEFDIALIGAGAYGLPLAAHAKRLAKKAIHMGGATQVLFGIRGNRWNDLPGYQKLFNEHWIRPSSEETITNSEDVEKACYW